MTKNFRSIGCILLIVAMIAPLVGCRAAASSPPVAKAPDACANQLHELCGQFLLYYSLNRDLPPTLDDLLATTGDASPARVACPVSGKPYLYDRNGLSFSRPVSTHRVILCDAAPSHSGRRWAIAIQIPAADQPLIAGVIPIPSNVSLETR